MIHSTFWHKKTPSSTFDEKVEMGQADTSLNNDHKNSLLTSQDEY